MESLNSHSSYISQAEASALAGVSVSTLMRFAEAGYFKILEQNGETQFSRLEISEVFGPAISSALNNNYISTKDNSKPQAEKQEEKIEIEQSPLESSNQSDKLIEAQPTSEKNSPLVAQVEKIIKKDPSSQTSGTNDYISENNQTTKSSTDAFRTVLKLQEELLADRENRISDLIKERDWLRSRLEKMEEKSDRDQMLLMVESQKVRTLIEKSPPKTGFLKLALDWMGGKQADQSTQK